MIDPTRLTEDRQTTLFELELLRAARQDVLVPSQRTRMLGGLGVIGFAQAPSGAMGSQPGGPLPAGPLQSGSLQAGSLSSGQAGLTAAGKGAFLSSGAGVGSLNGFLGKVFSAKGVLGATLLGTVALITVARVAQPPRSVAVPAPVEALVAGAVAAPGVGGVPAERQPSLTGAAEMPVAEELGSVRASDVQGATPARVAARQDSPEKSTLTRELGLIESARAALAENRPRVTLSRLDTYRTQFPHGRLGTEASMLRLEALVALGDRAGAQRIATRLLRNSPNSPYSPRIRSLLGDAVIPGKTE
jgi:hypothetical protein